MTQVGPGQPIPDQAASGVPPGELCVPSLCAWKGGFVPSWPAPMRGQKPGGPVVLTPQVKVTGWDVGSWGGALLPEIYPQSWRWVSLHPG